MDLKKLDKQVFRLAEENVVKNLEKLSRGQEISILSFLDDELYPRLRGKGYGLWVPPRDPERVKAAPYKNLTNLLLSPLRPQPILMLLDIFPDKATFRYMLGLSEQFGITYEKFVELVTDGTIILILSQLPSHFKSDFYEEIFHACDKQGYFPPITCSRISGFMARLKIRDLASKEGILLQSRWQERVLQKNPEYDYRENRNRITKIMSNGTLDKIMGESLLFDRDSVIDLAATALTDLNCFGFEQLSSIADKVMKKDDYYGFEVLDDYKDHLIYPCNIGLLGLLEYDLEDVAITKHLRKADDKSSSLREDDEGVLASSKPALSLVTAPFEANILSDPDPQEVDRFIEEPDPELCKNTIRLKNAANLYDFSELQSSYEKLAEIVSERYNKEFEDWFKRERIVKGTLRLGTGFTALAEAMTGWGNMNWLLKEYPLMGEISPTILQIIEGISEKDVSRFLVRKWPFAEKGLPFVLWKYEMKPEDI